MPATTYSPTHFRAEYNLALQWILYSEGMMESSVSTVIVTQAVITVFALLAAYIKLRQEIRKGRHERVYDLSLDRLKRQLGEFYGPLYMLTASTSDIADTVWGTDVWEEVWRGVIVPSHQEVGAILLTKIDLLDEAQIPQSYFDFLRHFNVSRGYLKSGLGKDYFEKDTPYPRQFNDDVANTYRKKRQEYMDMLKSAT
jgi:hypothetical protein